MAYRTVRFSKCNETHPLIRVVGLDQLEYRNASELVNDMFTFAFHLHNGRHYRLRYLSHVVRGTKTVQYYYWRMELT